MQRGRAGHLGPGAPGGHAAPGRAALRGSSAPAPATCENRLDGRVVATHTTSLQDASSLGVNTTDISDILASHGRQSVHRKVGILDILTSYPSCDPQAVVGGVASTTRVGDWQRALSLLGELRTLHAAGQVRHSRLDSTGYSCLQPAICAPHSSIHRCGVESVRELPARGVDIHVFHPAKRNPCLVLEVKPGPPLGPI